jgi:hypothetical protein
MRLLVVAAVAIGFGTLVLLGLLTMVRELFCDSPLEARFMIDKEAMREQPDQITDQVT